MKNLTAKTLFNTTLFGVVCFCIQLNAQTEDHSKSTAQYWRSETDRRIALYRTGAFELTCVDESGKKLGEIPLSVRQVGSDFHFGTAVTSQLPEGEGRESYLRFITENFNAVVAENAMKWYAIERTRDRRDYESADFIVRMAEEHGMSIRGHCLFWAKPQYNMRWLQELKADELKSETEAHLVETVQRYKNKLIAWDVNNEMLNGTFFQDKLGEGIRTWMFQRAAEIDPGVPLFVNEYGIVDSDEKTDRYFELIRQLQAQGAPVGGIGVQDHSVENFIPFIQREGTGEIKRTPADVWKRLDKLSELNLPIHLTEISCVTEDDQARADALELLFRVGYAHPNVEAIMLWGFWANRHWKGENAALVEADWTVNEAGKRIRELLTQTWRTRLDTQTNPEGQAAFQGFFGTYQILAEMDGNSVSGTVTLTQDYPSATVVLQ